MGRERELATGIAWNLRLIVPGARDEHVRLPQALEADDLATEYERVAGLQLGDEHLVDLAEHAPAGQSRGVSRRRNASATHEPHLQHRRIDNGAGVHAVLLGDARMGEAEPPV